MRVKWIGPGFFYDTQRQDEGQWEQRRTQEFPSEHEQNVFFEADSFGTAAESCQVLSAWRGGRAVSSWQEQSPGQLSTTAPPTSQPQQTPGARCVHAQPSLEVVNSAVKPSISRNSFKVGNKKWRVFKLLMGFMFLSLLRVCSLL